MHEYCKLKFKLICFDSFFILLISFKVKSSELTSTARSAESLNAGEVRWKRVGRWHDEVLALLSKMVASVSEGEWRQEVAAALGKQLDLYKDMPSEKV